MPAIQYGHTLPLTRPPLHMSPHRTASTVLRATVAALITAAAAAAQAATHALIMTIGDYPDPKARLPGVLYDAGMAHALAEQMGATRATIKSLSDRQLDLASMLGALGELRQRVRPGDTVMIYFSGHGVRRYSALSQTAGCEEGIVSFDHTPLLDRVLVDHLMAVATVADRVVMFNDSCHSGGGATRAFDAGSASSSDFMAKSFPGTLRDVQAKVPNAPADACAIASNALGRSAKSFERSPAAERKLLYMAASATDEVAWSTDLGGMATIAWHHCLGQPRADQDGDGWLSGVELAACANAHVQSRRQANGGRIQNITAVYNASLPLWRVTPASRR
jgi:metacaspase-1